MRTHVAFLRAINTGGRRITNDELVEAARSLGFADVSAYQASGNLLIGAEGSSRALADRLSDGLGEVLGFDVPAIVRSAAEVEAIAAADPFPGETPPLGGKPQVILLTEPISDPTVIDSYAGDDDRLAVVNADLHWWPREGISTSMLDIAGLERAVGTLTVRTLGTIERIAGKLS